MVTGLETSLRLETVIQRQLHERHPDGGGAGSPSSWASVSPPQSVEWRLTGLGSPASFPGRQPLVPGAEGTSLAWGHMVPTLSAPSGITWPASNPSLPVTGQEKTPLDSGGPVLPPGPGSLAEVPPPWVTAPPPPPLRPRKTRRPTEQRERGKRPTGHRTPNLSVGWGPQTAHTESSLLSGLQMAEK